VDKEPYSVTPHGLVRVCVPVCVSFRLDAESLIFLSFFFRTSV